MSVHEDGVFMAGKPEVLDKTKDKINMKFNIQDSGKLKNFLRVYYEWGRDAKGLYAKIIMENDIKKLVEGYKKHTGSDVKIQKNLVFLVRL